MSKNDRDNGMIPLSHKWCRRVIVSTRNCIGPVASRILSFRMSTIIHRLGCMKVILNRHIDIYAGFWYVIKNVSPSYQQWREI